MFGKRYTLVADIGGTNAKFAILENDKFIISKFFKCAEISRFEELLHQFLSLDEVKKFKIEKSCFSIAGPVSIDRSFARFTNLPWIVDLQELQKYNIGKILLINDFEAIGYAYDIMNTSQYVELSSLGRNGLGRASIIGAGTGLGTCMLIYQKGAHLPIQSEGGHTEIWINPLNTLEVQLYKYFKTKNILLDNESILSGPGIINIYNFLLSKKLRHNKKIAIEIRKASFENKPVLITKNAIEEKDYLCLKVLEIFIIFYARIAKNLCINNLCSELVIAGGIAPNILPLMQESFIEAFTSHERRYIRNMLENTTVLVIIDRNIGLIGAANAQKILKT